MVIHHLVASVSNIDIDSMRTCVMCPMYNMHDRMSHFSAPIFIPLNRTFEWNRNYTSRIHSMNCFIYKYIVDIEHTLLDQDDFSDYFCSCCLNRLCWIGGHPLYRSRLYWNASAPKFWRLWFIRLRVNTKDFLFNESICKIDAPSYVFSVRNPRAIRSFFRYLYVCIQL